MSRLSRSNLGMSLLDLNTIQSFKHNPTMYVELVGNALFSPMVLNYAPKEKRFQQIIKRLEKIPTLCRAGEDQPGGCSGGVEPCGARGE